LTALLSLRPTVSRSPYSSFRRSPCLRSAVALSGEGSRIARTAGFCAKPRAMLDGTAFSARAEGEQGASDAPCRARRGGASPSGGRTPRAAVPVLSSKRRLFRPGAPSAGERFCVRPFLQSRTIHEHGRKSLGPRAYSRGYPRAVHPGSFAPFRGVAGGASRVRGVGSGLRRNPPPTGRTRWDYPEARDYPAPLVARFGLGRQEEPTWPGTRPSTSEPTSAHAERCRRLIACAASRWQARSLELHREEKRQVPGPGVSSNVRGEPSAHQLSPGCCQPVDEPSASAVPDVLLPLTRRRRSPARRAPQSGSIAR